MAKFETYESNVSDLIKLTLSITSKLFMFFVHGICIYGLNELKYNMSFLQYEVDIICRNFMGSI